jgi:drug/metabolite transporter (DMT)-like permease
MEPIYAIILALLFFGESEQMTPGFYLGAAIILGTVIGNGVLKRYFRNKQRLGIEKG